MTVLFILIHHEDVMLWSQRLLTPFPLKEHTSPHFPMRHARRARITCCSCCRCLHRSHSLFQPGLLRLTCSRTHDSMSISRRKMLRAAVRGRARAAHQGRAVRPTHTRKDLELVSLVLTQLQHWRGQIIAAHAVPRDRHVQPMSQQTPKKLRDTYRASRSRIHCVQRVAEA